MTRLAALFASLGPDPRADGTLLQTFLRDRDQAAFAELVRRHGPTVWGVCRRLLPEADAEDAFQATFLILLRKRPGGDSLAGWLYRVAVFTCRGLRRRNARRRTVPLPDVPARPVPPVDVDALLLKLPEQERAAVVLVKLHGLTEREAADSLGVPEGTLSARLSRGLRRLRGADPAVLAVPATVAEAAVTVATAGRAAGPGVRVLVTEVLRMFWLKKLAGVGLAVGVVGCAVLVMRSAHGPAFAQAPATPATPKAAPQAQTPATMVVPPLRPGEKWPRDEGPNFAQRTEALVVAGGLPHIYQARSGKPLADVFVTDSSYIEAKLDPKNPSRVLLTGLTLGVTGLQLRDADGGRESIVVAVAAPPSTQVELKVGESMTLSLPNKRLVSQRDGASEVFDFCDAPAPSLFTLVARKKGFGFARVTDGHGLVWRFTVVVADPPAKKE